MSHFEICLDTNEADSEHVFGEPWGWDSRPRPREPSMLHFRREPSTLQAWTVNERGSGGDDEYSPASARRRECFAWV